MFVIRSMNFVEFYTNYGGGSGGVGDWNIELLAQRITFLSKTFTHIHCFE